jgi:hypothetical protein
MVVFAVLLAAILLNAVPPQRYPLHRDITATVFWVGEAAVPGSPANTASAWDDEWLAHYGGVDDPMRRNGFLPAGFTPKENPFYCALPYNDCPGGMRRANALTVIPWASEKAWGKRESLCKNRWVAITHNGKTAYAQWEDVGPFRTDDAAYVFGVARPVNRANQSAGIDVSPAVRDSIGLTGDNFVDWRFIDTKDVPPGPWKYTITASQIIW